MRLYGVRTGEPSPDLMGTVGTVAGVLVDEAGHLVASHVADTVSALRRDLVERACAYAHTAEIEYVWCDADRTLAPPPCPGCAACVPPRGSSVSGSQPPTSPAPSPGADA